MACVFHYVENYMFCWDNLTRFANSFNLFFCFCFFLNSTTFQYEKSLNIEQVEQMQAMEKNLIAMAREVEKLRVEVFNAENRVHGNIF